MLAAIVYDDEPGWPFPMDMPATHLPGPNIPAVLITQMSGFKLKAHCIDTDCVVTVDPVIDVCSPARPPLWAEVQALADMADGEKMDCF